MQTIKATITDVLSDEKSLNPVFSGLLEHPQLGFDVPSVLKVVLKKTSSAKREYKILDYLQKTHHPDLFFPAAHLLYVVETAHHLCFFFEKGENDLMTIIRDEFGSFTTQKKSLLCFQAARCLFEIHRRHIAHGDISPENFILKKNRMGEDELVLIDWGQSQCLNPEFPFHVNCGLNNPFDGQLCGKMLFVAPEISEFRPWHVFRHDLGCFAVMCYLMEHHEFPFGLDFRTKNACMTPASFFSMSHPCFSKSSLFVDFLRALLSKSNVCFDTKLMEHPYLHTWRNS